MSLKLLHQSYKLPLKYPFTTSRYTVNVQETVIVSITDGTYIGYGEATVNPYYGSTIINLDQSIKSTSEILKKANGFHPSELWQLLHPHLKHDYFALCAIDCAYWDLYSKQKQKPMRRFWSASDKAPMSNYTIGIDSIQKMKDKILEMPWPIYKIKLGTKNDIEIISELRKITDSVFRIDANCAWTVAETIENSKKLIELGVEFIEQPLAADNWEGMKQLKNESALPLIADESCQREEDVATCAEGFHGINIKLMKCGGITPALRMIDEARKLDLKVMAGCMTESRVGISNLAQIASLLDYLDADGSMLLKEDIAEGVKLQDGSIIFSHKNGSGASLKK